MVDPAILAGRHPASSTRACAPAYHKTRVKHLSNFADEQRKDIANTYEEIPERSARKVKLTRAVLHTRIACHTHRDSVDLEPDRGWGLSLELEQTTEERLTSLGIGECHLDRVVPEYR